MAWSPISLAVPQYEDANGNPYSGAVLKAYAAGTSTPISMATSSTGATTATSMALNASGYPVVSGNIVIPHVSENYKLALYPTQAAADANSGAIWSIDNLAPIGASGGAALIGFLQAGTGAVARTMQAKGRDIVSVKDFGAVGDFDPATGAGTNDRAAIQAALDYAVSLSGCKVWFPSGRYYTGNANGTYHAVTNPGTAQLVLGLPYTASSAKNIDIDGYGAEIYQGFAGKCLAIHGADRVKVSGLKMFGYTGGTLASSRENDACIVVSNLSCNVTIEDCYLTNSLGDCIYVGGDLGGATSGYGCRNITIRHNVLKERVGDGTASISSGTKSRFALAVIDCVGLDVTDNWIYGGVDLEPNYATENLFDIDIHNNHFKSGHVTPQSSIGTAYWHDEPVALSGATTIIQSVTCTSVTTPTVSNVSVRDNNFEYGIITFGPDPLTIDVIRGNSFEVGQIRTAGVSVSRVTIAENDVYANVPAESVFIKLGSYIVNSRVAGNRAHNGTWTFCVDDTGGSTGDNGANVWDSNTAEGGASLGFAPLVNSTIAGFQYVDTWTPTLTFATPGDLSVVYSSRLGTYSRIGQEVTLTCRIQTSTFTHTTAVGGLRITGLPFAARTLTNLTYEAAIRWQGITKANYTQVNAYINSAGSIVEFDAYGSGQVRSQIVVADTPTGGSMEIIFTMKYLTTAP